MAAYLGDPAPTWYSALWPYSAAWMVLCRGAVVLHHCKPRWWVAVPALGMHLWATGYPNRWPHSWLQAEIHTVAFCCLLFGLALLSSQQGQRSCVPLPKRRYPWAIRGEPGRVIGINTQTHRYALAALFVGTAAGLYPVPWATWLRPYLMGYQAACYLAIAALPPTPNSQ